MSHKSARVKADAMPVANCTCSAWAILFPQSCECVFPNIQFLINALARYNIIGFAGSTQMTILAFFRRLLPKAKRDTVGDCIDQLLVMLLIDHPTEITFLCFRDFVILSELVGSQWHTAFPISREYLEGNCARPISDAGAAIAASIVGRQNPFSLATADGPVVISNSISGALIRLTIKSAA